MKMRIAGGSQRVLVILVSACALGIAAVPFRREVVSTARAAAQWLQTPWLGPAYLGDGKPAESLLLCDPMGLALDRGGDVLVSDRGRARRGRVVWRIDADGVAHIMAGTGRRGKARGTSARGLSFAQPGGLALDREGRLHVTDVTENLVLRLEADGSVARVAGGGSTRSLGDGGSASEATLHHPVDIRFDSEDNLYIADVRNHRIRRVDTNGRIHTVAGTGEAGFSEDGTLARDARLNSPWGIAIDREDRLLIADSENHRVRRVEHDGTLVTIAGNGRRGFSGDGGAATDASLDTPQGLFVDDAGRVFIGDEHNHAVRVVHTDGTISTLAGTGAPGLAAVGSRAEESALNDPESILVLSDGSMIITEGDNGRVLRVSHEGILEPFAGRADTTQCAGRW